MGNKRTIRIVNAAGVHRNLAYVRGLIEASFPRNKGTLARLNHDRLATGTYSSASVAVTARIIEIFSHFKGLIVSYYLYTDNTITLIYFLRMLEKHKCKT